MALMSHFNLETVEYAESKGVPAASFLIPFTGLLASLGAISIVLGYKARTGALLIIVFLVPITLMMHAFWNETEQMKIQMEMGNFMRNISMLGAAMLISYFGSGPMSLDQESNFNKDASKDKLKY